jgi:hypothetical protein
MSTLWRQPLHRYAHLDADTLRRASDRIGTHNYGRFGDLKADTKAGANVVPLHGSKPGWAAPGLCSP